MNFTIGVSLEPTTSWVGMLSKNVELDCNYLKHNIYSDTDYLDLFLKLKILK